MLLLFAFFFFFFFFFCHLKHPYLPEVLLYTVAHPCGHLDDECAKLQVIKGVHIDDQGVLLQDTWLVKHKFNDEFIHLTSKWLVSWVLCNEDFFFTV